MTRLFFAWLALAAMCLLLVFKVNLNSDLLFLDSLAADLFRHGGAWRHWKFTPAPAYVPDMLAYAIGYFVFPTPPQRIVFVCLVQALLLAAACMYLARTIKPTFSVNAKVGVLLVTMGVVLVSANSSMWLFFSSTNNHFAALLFPLLCLAWAFRFLEKKALPVLVWITAGVAAGTASTSVFTLAFTLPAVILLAACAFVFRFHRQFRGSAFQLAGAILAGQGIAMVLRKMLLSFDALQGRTSMSVEGASRSFAAFVSATRVTFGTDNRYTLVLAIFLVLSIAWLLVDWVLDRKLSIDTSPDGVPTAWLKVSGTNWAYSLGVIFLLVVFPVNVMGAVLSGGFVDPWGYRYFSFPITLGVLLWIVMLDSKSAFNARWAGPVLILCMAAIAMLAVRSLKPLLAHSGRPSYASMFDRGAVGAGDAVGACIDAQAGKGFAFGAGIGDFWNARGISHKTGKPLHILPVLNDAMPFFHMMSVGPLIDPRQYGIASYNFVLMRKAGTTTQFDFTPDTVGRHLPRPARIVDCTNSDTELWLYTDLALDTVVKDKANLFLGQQGLVRDYRKAAAELPGEVGQVEAQSRVAEAGRDKTGYLSYGPYITLPPGRYQVTVSYTATEAGNKWDAGRFNNPQQLATLAAGDVPPGSGELKFSFETRSSVPDVEIRTWFGGHGVFKVHQIRMQAASSR